MTATDERWWIYKITDEQAQEIKQKNGEAIRRFWEDNEDIILRLIKSKFSRSDYYHKTTVDDCLSQVYVDLPTYGYKDSRDITYGIFKSCAYCIYGYSRRACLSLDTPLKGQDGLILSDTLVDKRDIEDCYDLSIQNERLYYKVAFLLFPKSAEKRSNFLRRL